MIAFTASGAVIEIDTVLRAEQTGYLVVDGDVQ
jgi:hypothetical protein